MVCVLPGILSPSSSGMFHIPPDQMDQPGAALRVRQMDRERSNTWGLEGTVSIYIADIATLGPEKRPVG